MVCCAAGGTSIISITLAGADVFSEVDGRNDFIPHVDILGGQPDETWGRFLKLSPEDKEKALAFVEASQ